MGFETQEDAERWAENIEAQADALREEKLFSKNNAWEELTKLPAYKDLTDGAKELQRAVFDYAWEASRRVKP